MTESVSTSVDEKLYSDAVLDWADEGRKLECADDGRKMSTFGGLAAKVLGGKLVWNCATACASAALKSSASFGGEDGTLSS